MIKFFRKIRQKLVDEGKLKRYLIYAIGEILLVVIGILIALQINNWNNNKSDREEEKISLQAISEKIKFNQFQYEFGKKRNNGVIIAAEELLTMMSNKSTPPSKIKVEQNLSTLTKRFLMGKSNAISIYDELVNAGQLSNISSQELRNQLANLKAQMQLLASYEDLQNQFVDNQLSPFLNKHIDRIPIGVIGAKTDSTFYDQLVKIDYSAFHQSTVDQSYEALLKNREFSNLLLELMHHTKTLLPIYDRIGVNISIIDSIAMESKTFL